MSKEETTDVYGSTKLKTNLKEVRNKFETLYFEGRMNSLQLLRSKYRDVNYGQQDYNAVHIHNN